MPRGLCQKNIKLKDLNDFCQSQDIEIPIRAMWVKESGLQQFLDAKQTINTDKENLIEPL